MRTVIIEKVVYPYAELNTKAKERVRDWYVEGLDWFADSVLEDFQQICALLGIELRERHVRLVSGQTRAEPCIYWRLAYSQGDGACFEGTYRYRKGASKAIRQYAPTDTTLHGIADALQAVQARWFYKLTAACRDYRNCCSLYVEIEHADDPNRSIDRETEREVQDQLERLTTWLYRQLREEYEGQTSEEAIADACEANSWEFDGSGKLHRGSQALVTPA